MHTKWMENLPLLLASPPCTTHRVSKLDGEKFAKEDNIKNQKYTLLLFFIHSKKSFLFQRLGKIIMIIIKKEKRSSKIFLYGLE